MPERMLVSYNPDLVLHYVKVMFEASKTKKLTDFLHGWGFFLLQQKIDFDHVQEITLETQQVAKQKAKAKERLDVKDFKAFATLIVIAQELAEQRGSH
jgi:hypothetical protein